MSGRDAINQAFANNSQLRKRIFDAIDATPQYAPLFEDIASYHLNSHPLNGSAHDEPASKKRKLPDGSSLPVAVAAQKGGQPREVIFEARDVSFSLPQRKKLHLGIAQYGTGINNAGTKFAIYTRNPATNEVDMEVPLDQVAYALRLPIPEKAAKQYNFVLLLKSESSNSNNTEAIIWAVNDGPLKSCHIPSPDLAKIAPGPNDILENVLDHLLQKSGKGLTLPTAEEFSSAKPESHRKGDKAYHVKAFRGSKDGYLFFLSNGIFFGFKKPLSFFAFEDVESISYTSVLQRTFNLNIVYRASSADGADGDGIQEVEFSMLDQADFPGIDAYVKRHGLQDASLAESRRAKKLNATALSKGAAVQNGDGGNAEGDGDGRTELEKAQQQIEEEEDEEEEDYDPGSEGESEGSGASDESDDDYDREYERERKKMKGRDLVKEELGSEAEDVSVTEEEDEEDEGEEEGDEEGDEEEEVHGDEDDHYDEQDASYQVPSHDKHTAVSGAGEAHGADWGYEAGMPDPDDEDQL
ncbi:uncharacterized protein PV07_03396 [Cladophialophora immunda]|uniref:Histone chaperone RTT106/FACT complex subunit SPT16-like middle domain-containing protein n=1 Tax=Cladophialophora immunda TaxID=569365 RepID=A0A0D2D7T7_9EURO|nr:uncharacterized protein PV07_03396 [Cladophialophora immunda]KIW31804.1 hypothetical protein PV07_03396 [Cladophialophora immunda]OQV10549.1 hypothetical protein CLAIMM_14530 [Cladophialophora immunda]